MFAPGQCRRQSGQSPPRTPEALGHLLLAVEDGSHEPAQDRRDEMCITSGYHGLMRCAGV
jgi:hypothetical protein